MKLDRNLNDDGMGKYALLLMRNLALCENGAKHHGLGPRYTPKMQAAIELLIENHIIDWGQEGSDSEFFVIRLKDKYAHDALLAYALAAEMDGQEEWAAEVRGMALRAGPHHSACQRPN